jgi:hypothetical protein
MRVLKLLLFVFSIFSIISCGGSDLVETETRKSTRAAADYYDTVQKAYIAYYGRPADSGGLEFWAGRVSDANGDISAIMDAFGNSQEFNDRYGSLSNSELITKIYQQMYNREPDSGGLAFYANLLDTGESNLQQITLNVMNGSQNEDLDKINNKLSAAKSFTSTLSTNNADYPLEYATTYLSQISEDTSTIETASSSLNTFLGVADDDSDNTGSETDSSGSGDSNTTPADIQRFVIMQTGMDVSTVNFDDAYYKSGVAPSRTRDASTETVTDNVTGLIWQDNAITAENKMSSAAEADAYCKNLSHADQRDWRLPSVAELMTISDAVVDIDENLLGFEYLGNITSNYRYYWSSTPVARPPFDYVTNHAVSVRNLKSQYTAVADSLVACVRGEAKTSALLPVATFTRNSDGVVTDSSTGLMWQDNILNEKLSWRDSITYCNSLELGGYSDWKLPNTAEATSIINYNSTTLALPSIFEYGNGNDYFNIGWTSTDSSAYTRGGTVTIFDYLYTLHANGADSAETTHFFRCVRTP